MKDLTTLTALKALERASYYKNLADYIRDDDPDGAEEYDLYAEFYKDLENKKAAVAVIL